MEEEWNIIPIIKNSKKPAIKWLDYQTKKFPRKDLLLYNTINKAVICGKISNNLVIVDFDFEGKPKFDGIIGNLRKNFPEISNTLISMTPHGLHIYFYIKDGECPQRQTQLKSPFPEIKHVDILGEAGYALIPPSIIDNEFYMTINDSKVATISRELFDKIIASYTIQKEEEKIIVAERAKKKELLIGRFRKPFQWILTGEINVKKLAQQTGEGILKYWTGLYAEAISLGYEPEQLFPILRTNQNRSFDIKKSAYQVPYHKERGDFDKPLTSRILKKLFPSYSGIEREVWVDIAEELEAEFDIVSMSDSKKLMIKEGNIYTDKTDVFFKELDNKLIKRTLGKRYDYYKRQILSHIRDANRFDRENFCYESDTIPFLNGYYDISQKKFILAENSKKVFCYAIPHEYLKDY